jgi:hypothetical protein
MSFDGSFKTTKRVALGGASKERGDRASLLDSARRNTGHGEDWKPEQHRWCRYVFESQIWERLGTSPACILFSESRGRALSAIDPVTTLTFSPFTSHDLRIKRRVGGPVGL